MAAATSFGRIVFVNVNDVAPLSQVVLYFQDWSFWSFLAQAVALTEVSKAKDNLCVLFVLVLFGECFGDAL